MDADQEREALFHANRGLALSAVRRFGNGRADEDMLSVAFMALWQATERWDPKRGVRFSTYAHSLIAGALKRYLCEVSGGLIHVPRYLLERPTSSERSAMRYQVMLVPELTASHQCDNGGAGAISVPMEVLERAVGSRYRRGLEWLLLRIRYGETLREIGEREGLSPQAIAYRIRRAVELLRRSPEVRECLGIGDDV